MRCPEFTREKRRREESQSMRAKEACFIAVSMVHAEDHVSKDYSTKDNRDDGTYIDR